MATAFDHSGGSSYGWTGPPSTHWPKLWATWSWLGEAVRLRHGSELSFKSLTFGPSFAWKWTKAFSFRGLCPLTSHQGLCPWIPLGAPTPDPRYRLTLHVLAMVRPLWQILDPPLLDQLTFTLFGRPEGRHELVAGLADHRAGDAVADERVRHLSHASYRVEFHWHLLRRGCWLNGGADGAPRHVVTVHRTRRHRRRRRAL